MQLPTASSLPLQSCPSLLTPNEEQQQNATCEPTTAQVAQVMSAAMAILPACVFCRAVKVRGEQALTGNQFDKPQETVLWAHQFTQSAVLGSQTEKLFSSSLRAFSQTNRGLMNGYTHRTLHNGISC